METTDRCYAAFARLLEEGETFRDPSLTFTELCARAGADPEALETLLSSELGFSGEALLEEYREWALAIDQD